jgi:TrmH family RNA methyltransferase
MRPDSLSKNNSKLKELKKIIKETNDYLLIEGMKLFNEAVKSKIQIEKIYIDKNNIDSLLKAYPQYKNIEITFVNNDLLSENYTTDNNPEGEDLILALAKRPKWEIDSLFKRKQNIVFLERIQDPGNLGMILRSALAFSSGGVCLSEYSVNPFNTKVIRASAGAVFSMPVFLIGDFDFFCKQAQSYNYKIIATRVNAKKTLEELKSPLPLVFLFGNEGSGLSDKMVELSDDVIRIPHSEKVESLNLGVAVSLILWEVF